MHIPIETPLFCTKTRYQDRLDKATECINQAIKIYRDFNDLDELSLSIRRLASIQIKLGDLQNARINLEQALEFAKEVDNKRYISRIQRQLAKLDIDDRNYNDAEQRLIQARSYRENETEFSSGLAYTYRLLGQIAVAKNKYRIAEDHFLKSLQIGEAISSQPDIAESKQGLAILNFSLGNYQDAQNLIEDAIVILKKLGMQSSLVEAERLFEKITGKAGSLGGILDQLRNR